MINNLVASTTDRATDGRHTVHVWTVTLGASALRREDLSILSTDERRRAFGFAADCLRRRFVTARVALRRVLAQYLRIPPVNLRFRYGCFGKPQLLTQADRPIYFNLSHSEDRAVIAVTTEGRVGIDLEWVPADGIWDTVAPVAARFFTAMDRDALMALPRCERLRGFYQIWTRKEAHLKACGLGVAGLDRFSMAVAGDASHQTRWRVTDLPVGGKYVAALALDVEHPCILWRDADGLITRSPGPIAGVEAAGILAADYFPNGRGDALLTA
jgi:4'-phosphopantetheinyl transferase